jgi:exodeoxyribonuclease VII large subunit
MFRNRNHRLRARPASGDAVRLRARVSLYEGRGEFQLIVEHLEPAGAGALQAAFERLRDLLRAEGLFDPARKRPLPPAPARVGIVTSPSGAAIHDILTVFRRRSPGTRLFLFPVRVQGEGAAEDIAGAIERANRWHAAGSLALDTLIVGRGGGSLEDLWAFNEERVARAIAASELPVVSAVGHEVDFSIADLVADQRAPTPSAAAELLSLDQRDMLAGLAAIEATLLRGLQRLLSRRSTTLNHLQRRLKHPGHLLREQSQRLDDMEQRLLRAQRALLRERGAALRLASQRLHNESPARRLPRLEQQLAHLRARLERASRGRLRDARDRLGRLVDVLDSVSPLRTLGRGYAIVTAADGSIVHDAGTVQAGDRLDARLAQGRLELEVLRAVAGEKEPPPG